MCLSEMWMEIKLRNESSRYCRLLSILLRGIRMNEMENWFQWVDRAAAMKGERISHGTRRWKTRFIGRPCEGLKGLWNPLNLLGKRFESFERWICQFISIPKPWDVRKVETHVASPLSMIVGKPIETNYSLRKQTSFEESFNSLRMLLKNFHSKFTWMINFPFVLFQSSSCSLKQIWFRWNLKAF